MNLFVHEDSLIRNNLFTYKDVIDDNEKLRTCLNKIFNQIDLSNLIIEKYDGDLLKDRSAYGYYDLYINKKLKSKTVFRINFSSKGDKYLDKIYEVILNDIKSNKNNTYYFNRFKDVSEYLCLELMLNNGIIEEIRDNKSIKQFTKKNRSYSK